MTRSAKNAGFPNEPTAKFINACGKWRCEKMPFSRNPNQSHRKPTIGFVAERGPPAADGFVPHSPFSIQHSAFARCHTMTLREKNVLAKRTQLTCVLHKNKSCRMRCPFELSIRRRLRCRRSDYAIIWVAGYMRRDCRRMDWSRPSAICAGRRTRELPRCSFNRHCRRSTRP